MWFLRLSGREVQTSPQKLCSVTSYLVENKERSCAQPFFCVFALESLKRNKLKINFCSQQYQIKKAGWETFSAQAYQTDDWPSYSKCPPYWNDKYSWE